MHILLIVSFFLFIIPIFVTIGMRRVKKRNAGLQEFAERYHMTFEEKGESNLLDELDSFHLFSKGGGRKINGLLSAKTKEAFLNVFDYSFTTHNGKTTQKWVQTVVYFKSDSLNLPSFAMRPENIFHKIGSTLGYQDIDFDSFPEFSKHFLLRGEDENSIRKIFNNKVLYYFNDKTGISVEGFENKLIIYKNARQIKIDALKEYIDEAIQIFQLFSRGNAQ